MNRKRNAQVLFLMDYGSTDVDVLNAVIALTGNSPADVLGLVIEDLDLIGAASWPDNVEVTLHSAQLSAFNKDTIRRSFLQEANQKRELFETSAKRLNLPYSFQISRGRRQETLIQAASDKDVVIIGRPMRSGIRMRNADYYAELASQGPDVLFVNEPWQSGTSVVVVIDNTSPSAQRALATARSIATEENIKLICASSSHHSINAEDDVDQRILIPDLEVHTLLALCRRYDARLLVLATGQDMNWQDLLVGLLRNLSSSLLKIA